MPKGGGGQRGHRGIQLRPLVHQERRGEHVQPHDRDHRLAERQEVEALRADGECQQPAIGILALRHPERRDHAGQVHRPADDTERRVHPAGLAARQRGDPGARLLSQPHESEALAQAADPHRRPFHLVSAGGRPDAVPVLVHDVMADERDALGSELPACIATLTPCCARRSRVPHSCPRGAPGPGSG